MDAPHQNLISNAAIVTRAIDDLLGKIERIDVVYNGQANYSAQITDQTIAEVPVFAQAGLTKAALDADIFTLKQIAAQIHTINFEAWIMLASLS